jgi:hypothetical protein
MSRSQSVSRLNLCLRSSSENKGSELRPMLFDDLAGALTQYSLVVPGFDMKLSLLIRTFRKEVALQRSPLKCTLKRVVSSSHSRVKVESVKSTWENVALDNFTSRNVVLSKLQLMKLTFSNTQDDFSTRPDCSHPRNDTSDSLMRRLPGGSQGTHAAKLGLSVKVTRESTPRIQGSA